MNTKKLILVFIFLTLFFTSAHEINAQVLFSDDFETSGISNWNIIHGTWSTGSDLNYTDNNIWSIANAPSASDYEIQAGDFGWTNYRFSFDILPKTGVDRNIFFRVLNERSTALSGHDLPISYSLQLTDTLTYIAKWSNSSVTVPVIVQQGLSNNNKHHIQIDVVGNKIKIYVNDMTNPIINYEDLTNPILNGRIALASITGSSPSQVWFDNVVVTQLPEVTPSPSPSPSVSPSPSPSASPSGTPIANIGSFELPINYTGRLSGNSTAFKNAFWNRMTAVFDHSFNEDLFTSFTGNTVASSSADLVTCNPPLNCYNSHNGTDFSNAGDGFAYSVGLGKVVYTSPHTETTCTQESSYGCVVITSYSGNTYALYAHLNSIQVNLNQNITSQTVIGTIGNTGCPGCGNHLHFGVLKPVNDKLVASNANLLNKKDWDNLITQMAANNRTKRYKPYCTYKAPNGISFAFQDPSGWFGNDKDPWSLPRSKDGCGINSPYLWRYNIL